MKNEKLGLKLKDLYEKEYESLLKHDFELSLTEENVKKLLNILTYNIKWTGSDVIGIVALTENIKKQIDEQNEKNKSKENKSEEKKLNLTFKLDYAKALYYFLNKKEGIGYYEAYDFYENIFKQVYNLYLETKFLEERLNFIKELWSAKLNGVNLENEDNFLTYYDIKDKIDKIYKELEEEEKEETTEKKEIKE